MLLSAALLQATAQISRAGDAAPGTSSDRKARSHRSLSIESLCRDGIERDLELREERMGESTELCERGRIAEPMGKWSCEPADPPNALGPCGETEPSSPFCGMASRCRGGFVRCHHGFRCRPETPDYNRKALRRKRQTRLRADFARMRMPSSRSSSPSTDGDCNAFPEQLSRCRAFRCREPHPTLPALSIERSVVGLDQDECVFRERVKGGLSLECRLDAGARSRYSARLRKLRDEPTHARAGEPPLDLAAEALAAASCQPLPPVLPLEDP